MTTDESLRDGQVIVNCGVMLSSKGNSRERERERERPIWILGAKGKRPLDPREVSQMPIWIHHANL